MRGPTDRSAESLRRKLAGFEEHLCDLKKMMSTVDEISRGDVGREIAAAEAAVKRVSDDASAARARMQLQKEEGALADSGQVEAWKRDREGEALRSRAEDSEAYAAWSLIVATRAIHEVRLAALKAITARMDFENGSGE